MGNIIGLFGTKPGNNNNNNNNKPVNNKKKKNNQGDIEVVVNSGKREYNSMVGGDIRITPIKKGRKNGEKKGTKNNPIR